MKGERSTIFETMCTVCVASTRNLATVIISQGLNKTASNTSVVFARQAGMAISSFMLCTAAPEGAHQAGCRVGRAARARLLNQVGHERMRRRGGARRGDAAQGAYARRFSPRAAGQRNNEWGPPPPTRSTERYLG